MFLSQINILKIKFKFHIKEVYIFKGKEKETNRKTITYKFLLKVISSNNKFL